MGIEERQRTLVQAVTSAITERTERDIQQGIGPSEIGDPCDLCVGRALARRYPGLWGSTPLHVPTSFSLKAWVGTSIHRQLEEALRLPGAEKEKTVRITRLEEYGGIKGHADLIWDHIVLDYKSSDKAKIDQIRLNGPSWRYTAQINLYAYGLTQNHDYPVDHMCLFFIPRDSNRIRDAFPLFMEYRADYAALALARLEHIWQRVKNGYGPELAVHPDCYSCRIREWAA